jgi:LEA14-like dessication related protein
MRFFKFLALCALVIFAGSCSPLKPLSISNIQSVKLVNMQEGIVTIEAQVSIQNPNDYGFSVGASDMDLMLNNAFVGKAKMKDKIRINRKSDKTYTFQVEANMAQLLMNGLMNMGAMKGKSKIRIKGDLKVSKFGLIHRKIPVDLEKAIDLGQL